MTMQAERPTDALADPSLPRRSSRAGLIAALTAALLGVPVAVAVMFGFVAPGGHIEAVRPPRAVLGQSLSPLAVYRVVTGASPAKIQEGERAVPEMDRVGHSTVLQSNPAISLHVRYAHVRPVNGRWLIEFMAPEGTTFNVRSTQGQFFDVLLSGRALSLFFLEDSEDGTNFGIGAGANRLSQDQAVAVARALTTSVTVAHCSTSAIDANECG